MPKIMPTPIKIGVITYATCANVKPWFERKCHTSIFHDPSRIWTLLMLVKFSLYFFTQSLFLNHLFLMLHFYIRWKHQNVNVYWCFQGAGKCNILKKCVNCNLRLNQQLSIKFLKTLVPAMPLKSSWFSLVLSPVPSFMED